MKTQISRSRDRQDGFGRYLSEIGRYEIPTFEQEQKWGKAIQRWILLKDDAEARSTIAPEEFQRIAKIGEISKRKMVEHNLRLVVFLAKKHQNRGLDLEDIVQEGAIGLDRAAEKFDPTRGYKFSTYAYWWIRQAITRAIAEQSRTIRLPVHVTEKLNRIKRLAREFSQQHGRMPTRKEIQELRDKDGKLVLDPSTIALIGSPRALDALSLDYPISSPGKSESNLDPILDFIADSDLLTPDAAAEDQELANAVSLLLDALPERQKFVIEARNGMLTGTPQTLSEVGSQLGLSRERVRQVQNAAMRSLKAKAQRQSSRLRGFLD